MGRRAKVAPARRQNGRRTASLRVSLPVSKTPCLNIRGHLSTYTATAGACTEHACLSRQQGRGEVTIAGTTPSSLPRVLPRGRPSSPVLRSVEECPEQSKGHRVGAGGAGTGGGGTQTKALIQVRSSALRDRTNPHFCVKNLKRFSQRKFASLI
jgi:hypothetical protein